MKKLNLATILVLSGVAMSFGQVSITSSTSNAVVSTTPIVNSNNNSIGSSLANTTTTFNSQTPTNSLGYANNVFGSNSLLANTTGSFNNVLGHSSLLVNTSGSDNTAIGSFALRFNDNGSDNIAVGRGALYSNESGSHNTVLGSRAMVLNKTGVKNIVIGELALSKSVNNNRNIALGAFTLLNFNDTTIGNSFNIAIGNSSMQLKKTGKENTAIGIASLQTGTTGDNNTCLGFQSLLNTSGNNNLALGHNAGLTNTSGSNNVFIGSNSGFGTTTDQLFIDNTSTATPLIHGDFSARELKFNGKVGIGVDINGNGITFPSNTFGTPLADVTNYKLFVLGGILAHEVRIRPATGATWADYVFKADYNLKSLTEVEAYINENGHLPNVPSAKKVKAEGIAVSEMITIQQEKIEELTLYLIELSKEVEALKAAKKQ